MANRQFSYITNMKKKEKRKRKRKRTKPNQTFVHDFLFFFQISDVASLG